MPAFASTGAPGALVMNASVNVLAFGKNLPWVSLVHDLLTKYGRIQMSCLIVLELCPNIPKKIDSHSRSLQGGCISVHFVRSFFRPFCEASMFDFEIIQRR